MTAANESHSGALARVIVVTVTYGQRQSLLDRNLTALQGSNLRPDAIVVVDNASHPSTMVAPDQTVPTTVLRQNTNTGSAAGFAIGIEWAIKNGAEYVWLLDDDNVCEPDALKRLMATAAALRDSETPPVLAAMRPQRSKYCSAASGGGGLRFAAPDSFLGFDLLDRLRKFVRRTQPSTSAEPIADLVPVDTAIFGGLLLHRSAVAQVGLPNRLFYLYLDDREYCTRMHRAGIPILLVPQARVFDIDDSWGGDARQLPIAVAPEGSAFKTYYTLRNAVYYDRQYVVRSTLRYWVNAAIYMLAAVFLAIIHGVPFNFLRKRIPLIRRALIDGWHGSLGERPSAFFCQREPK